MFHVIDWQLQLLINAYLIDVGLQNKGEQDCKISKAQAATAARRKVFRAVIGTRKFTQLSLSFSFIFRSDYSDLTLPQQYCRIDVEIKINLLLSYLRQISVWDLVVSRRSAQIKLPKYCVVLQLR